jgi:nucleotide-binding universal stress UspA family protein
MAEKILVPLDGSTTGEAALKIVANIITKFSADIKVDVTLLQVLTSLSHYVMSGDTGVQVLYTNGELEALRNQSLEYLKQAGDGLAKLGANINVRLAVGNAAEEILKASEEFHADLIAMSTHGRSGITRLALGSVTEKVLRGSSRPVMVVKAK